MLGIFIPQKLANTINPDLMFGFDNGPDLKSNGENVDKTVSLYIAQKIETKKDSPGVQKLSH